MSVDMPMWPVDNDDRIDETARQLTEGASLIPGADFKRRVLARIEDRQPRARPRAWLLAPAAVAVIVLAIVVSRDGMKTSERAEVRLKPDATGEVRLTDSAGATSVKKADTTTTTAGAIRLTPDPATARTQAAAAPTAGMAAMQPVVPELGVEAIEIAPLAVETLNVDALGIAPAIVVAAVEIDPLEVKSLDQ